MSVISDFLEKFLQLLMIFECIVAFEESVVQIILLLFRKVRSFLWQIQFTSHVYGLKLTVAGC